MSTSAGKHTGGESPVRCAWATDVSARECEYHDSEWGVPVHDERTLFEFLILEGAQAGLSWRTILDKRDGYREAFDGFDPVRVAAFDEARVAALLANPGIVRNRLKVNAAVSNARCFLEVAAQYGSFDAWLWAYVDGQPIHNRWRVSAEVPASSALSDKVSKDLKRRGFKFVGSTIMYSYMQAVGLINDHLLECFRYPAIASARG